jgi:methionyl-tRNA formyltransferase
MRLIFAGTPQIAAQALAALSSVHEIALVITKEDAPVGRKKIVTPSPVALTAERMNLPLIRTSKVATAIGDIKAADADLAVVVAYGALVPKQALEILPWWNIHYSLLPKWRGATPLQHSMMHDTGAGISVFELEQGLDTGPLISQLPMKFSPTETAQEALERFTNAGAELLLRSLLERPAPKAQQGEPSLAPKISREQARIDFRSPADLLARTINALNPEPTAWALFADQPIKLLRAKSLGGVDWSGFDEARNPGELWLSENRVLLQCGHGTRIELIELQPAGKKPMTAIDFIRGQQKGVVLD